MNISTITENKYVFFGYECLYSRTGLGLVIKDMTPQDEKERIIEIIQIYKDTWGYEDVIIKKDCNDPYMVLVYVKPNKPYSINFYQN